MANSSDSSTDISRRTVLQGAAALGVLSSGMGTYVAPGAAIAATMQGPLSKPSTPYIGTPAPRIDGRAKVTGAAKYAAEFDAPGLLHGSIVTSTIAKGRIRRIDAGEALSVDGVVSVLTHENRPPLPDNDQAYKDDVAPDGSPFRPLYDGKIMFNTQPIALVVAETLDAAQFAASLVRVEY